MSTDPTGLGKDYEKAVSREYLNVTFTPESWCTYKGRCRAADLMFNAHNKVCFLCCYREPLDVPTILEEAINSKR
jgi:hypothetical protein